MEVTYYVRNSHGMDLAWPESQDAHMLCDATGNKTLTVHVLKTLKAYGVTVTEIFKPSNLS